MKNTQFVESIQILSNRIRANKYSEEKLEVKEVASRELWHSMSDMIHTTIRWEPQQVLSWLNKGVELHDRRERKSSWGGDYVMVAASELKVMLRHVYGQTHEELVAKMLHDVSMAHLLMTQPEALNSYTVARTCETWQAEGYSRTLNPTMVVQSHEIDVVVVEVEDEDPEHYCVAHRPHWICTCPNCMPVDYSQ